jgi:N-formylglutamate deformylase
MTDWHTAELFAPAIAALGLGIEFPVSRLLVDPERFSDDEQESMTAVGMGVLYTKTSDGREIRSQGSTVGTSRNRLLNEYYFPHHMAFTKLVEEELLRSGAAIIVDCHSFPSKPLPYEFDQNPNRPDICIGTDEFHTPGLLSRSLEHEFCKKGYRVALNTPFAGAIVPQRFYQTRPDVSSVMIEINRSLYMDEITLEKRQNFDQIGLDILSCLESLCGEFTGRP